jgi:hypothetical protein
MKKSSRIFHIDTEEPQKSQAEVALTPKDLGDKLGAFAPKNFKDSTSVMVNGFLERADDNSTHKRLNIKYYNPEAQPAFMNLFAELAYRDLMVPEHGIDKYYLRIVNDELHLQKLVRKAGESALRYVDCDQDTVDKVADWLEAFHTMKVVKPN